jgi:hypothetical protein
LKQAGREQNLSGQQQEAQGQVNDYVSGVSDRVAGTVGNITSSFTGDREAQAQYQRQHDEGKTQQRGVEYDLQKRVDASNQ